MVADLLREVVGYVAQHEALMVTASALSIGLFVVGALAGPHIVARLPEDYFVAPPRSFRERSLGRLVVALLRNLVGVVLLVVGVALLVLPGQGLLTILAGLFVMEFPAKNALLRHSTRSPGVRRSLNWLRRRMHRPPLRFEES